MFDPDWGKLSCTLLLTSYKTLIFLSQFCYIGIKKKDKQIPWIHGEILASDIQNYNKTLSSVRHVRTLEDATLNQHPRDKQMQKTTSQWRSHRGTGVLTVWWVNGWRLTGLSSANSPMVLCSQGSVISTLHCCVNLNLGSPVLTVNIEGNLWGFWQSEGEVAVCSDSLCFLTWSVLKVNYFTRVWQNVSYQHPTDTV